MSKVISCLMGCTTGVQHRKKDSVTVSLPLASEGCTRHASLMVVLLVTAPTQGTMSVDHHRLLSCPAMLQVGQGPDTNKKIKIGVLVFGFVFVGLSLV